MLRETGQGQQQFVFNDLADHQTLIFDQQRVVTLGQAFRLGLAVHQCQPEFDLDGKIHTFEATLAGQMQLAFDMTLHTMYTACITPDGQTDPKLRDITVPQRLGQPLHPNNRQRTAIFAARGPPRILQGRRINGIRQPVSHKPRIITITSICVKTKNAGFSGSSAGSGMVDRGRELT